MKLEAAIVGEATIAVLRIVESHEVSSIFLNQLFRQLPDRAPVPAAQSRIRFPLQV
jgi:hypothetical protein